MSMDTRTSDQANNDEEITRRNAHSQCDTIPSHSIDFIISIDLNLPIINENREYIDDIIKDSMNKFNLKTANIYGDIVMNMEIIKNNTGETEPYELCIKTPTSIYSTGYLRKFLIDVRNCISYHVENTNPKDSEWLVRGMKSFTVKILNK